MERKMSGGDYDICHGAEVRTMAGTGLLLRANYLPLGVSHAKRLDSSGAIKTRCATGSLRSERIFEAKARWPRFHIDPKRTMASTPRLGMNPAIMPIKKHQVASIVCFSGGSNSCLARTLTEIADADLAKMRQ